jgi:hypothetical protein
MVVDPEAVLIRFLAVAETRARAKESDMDSVANMRPDGASVTVDGELG